jgi:hypothetical protein
MEQIPNPIPTPTPIPTNCEHYSRKCMIRCPDPKCNKWYKCRLCHNDVETHELDRFNINEIRCKECETVQSPSNKCIKCEIEFATYYCEKCKLWGDMKAKHCDKCGLCRKMNNDEELPVHCDKCGTCMAETHICQEDWSSGLCVICRDSMFSSTKFPVRMKCGHHLHMDCMKEYIETEYRCPICHKSLYDMESHWKILDILAEREPVPYDYKDWKREVTCIDCAWKGPVKFHMSLHKCGGCGGYNVQKDSIIRNDPIPEEEESDEEEEKSDEEESKEEEEAYKEEILDEEEIDIEDIEEFN